MTEECKTLVRRRLQMAEDTLNDALLLHSAGGSPWSLANRAYYAMFYAVTALLIDIGQGASKHAGAIALFDQHYVKTRRFPVEMSKWLHRAFDLRQRGDYQEIYPLEPQEVEEILQWARTFVTKVSDSLRREQENDGKDVH